jgi:hypothetical protein
VRRRRCSRPSRRVSFLYFESRRGAGPATDRPYVMRRGHPSLQRRLAQLAAAVLLVAAVAVAVVWGWSYVDQLAVSTSRWSYNAAAESEESREWRVIADSGRLIVTHSFTRRWVYSPAAAVKATRPRAWEFGRKSAAGARVGTGGWWQGLGFGWHSSRYSHTAPSYASVGRGAMLPMWLPFLLLFAGPGASAFRSWRRRRRGEARRAAARCTACGYDLRATPERCPECGAAPQPPHNPPMQRTAAAASGAVE